MSRRGRLHSGRFAALVAAPLVVALAACSSPTGDGGSDGGGEIVIASYGGSFQEAQDTAFFTPFTEESGITVLDTEGTGYDALLAQSEAGAVTWDVVSAESGAYANEVKSDLLEPLDFDVIDVTGLPAEMVTDYGVGYIQFSLNLTWNADEFDSMTPAEFFDPAVKARRAIPLSPSYILEFALLGDGVAPADLYPLDVDRAFAALDRVKDQIVAFKDASDIQALIQQGEVDAAFTPSGRVEDAIAAGANWAYSWDSAVRDTEFWTVAKGAPNAAGAMEFIDFAIKAEPQAALAEAIPYGPTNEGAFELLSDELSSSLPSYPANAELGVSVDPTWWADNLVEVKSRWDAWMLS